MSYTRSRPARKDAANQNLLRRNFIAYIFRSQRAREQECKRESKSKSARALLLTSLGVRAQERKSARAKARERMAKPRPFLRRIILRLGRITP